MQRPIWAITWFILCFFLSQQTYAVAQQTIADPSAQGSLRLTTTHSGTGNLYTYQRITPTGQGYVVVTGDSLEYDVYCSLANTSGVCDGGAEIDFTDGNALRGLGNADQNGITSTWGDISAYAKGRWYHRKISLPAAAVTKTINYISLVEETDVSGSFTNYYRGIYITNGTTIKSVIWDTGVPAANTLAYGSGSSGSDASGSYYDEIYVAGSGNSYFAGRVGLGTINPLSRLHVSGTAETTPIEGYDITNSNVGNVVRIGTPTNRVFDGGVVLFETASTPAAFIKSGAVNGPQSRLYFGTYKGANVMSADLTIGATGNVGVGTTGPDQILTVQSGGGTTGTITHTINSSALAVNNLLATDYTFNAGTHGRFGMIETSTATYGLADFTWTTWNGITFGERMRLTSGGNVGIGTTSPQAKLHVAGDALIDGNIAAKYQDVAEWVPASHAMLAGTVVVLEPEHSNQVTASSRAYDTRVAGVVSASPGVILGEGGSGKVMVATTGRVRVKVDATSAPIHVGDLLVTSDKEGIAMRSQPVDIGGTPFHRPGTLIGKALEPLDRGVGEILVLLSLQ